jgi:hypothetical protein
LIIYILYYLGHSNKSSPAVITVSDDDPVYDDALEDFSTSELQERSQFSNDRFKLDYSAILSDKSNKMANKPAYRGNRETEMTSASTSKPAEILNKKRTLPTNTAKTKRQRCQSRITSLLELSDSEDEGNCILSFFVYCLLILINFIM